MLKARPWNGNDLLGTWDVTRKLDGVRAIVEGGIAVSRAGKPLLNLAQLPDGDYEVFDTDWSTTVSRVRKSGVDITPEHAYSLEPLDARLYLSTLINPTAGELTELMFRQVAAGDEGLVVRQGNRWLKVKPINTFDVPVIGSIPGRGKHTGRMGALITPMGNVGTGFTDEQRGTEYPEGTIIEVESQGLTPDEKFRFPRFIRVRFDK